MGLSMGGTLALRLAEEHGDDVAGVVLVNPCLLTTPRQFLLPVLHCSCRRWPGIATTSRSRAGRGAPTTASRSRRSTRSPSSGAHPRRPRPDHPAAAGVPLRRRPRRRAGQLRAAARKVVLDRRARGRAARQLPRRHARQRRADDLRGQPGLRPPPRQPAERRREPATPGATTGCHAASYAPLSTSTRSSPTPCSSGCATRASPPTARHRRATGPYGDTALPGRRPRQRATSTARRARRGPASVVDRYLERARRRAGLGGDRRGLRPRPTDPLPRWPVAEDLPSQRRSGAARLGRGARRRPASRSCARHARPPRPPAGARATPEEHFVPPPPPPLTSADRSAGPRGSA